MGPFLQFRLWLKEASRLERQFTLVAALVALGILSWALVPGGSADEQQSEAVLSSAPTELATTASGASAPGKETRAGLSATAAGRTSSTGGSESSSSSTPESPTGSAAGGVRTASDQGVTATTIKVGFTVLNLAAAASLGIDYSTRGDTEEVIDAMIDWANDAGGVSGRKLVAVKKSVNLAESTSDREACLELTRRHKVFAVIDSFAFNKWPAQACVTIENRTPLIIAAESITSAGSGKAAPYLVSPMKNANRIMKDWVFGMKGLKWFEASGGFRQLGILGDTCLPSVYDAADGLKAYLRQAGISTWSEFRLTCGDTSAQAREVQQAILQHRQDGVSHVLLATNPFAAKSYLESARQQPDYRPRVGVADLWGLTSDAIANTDWYPNELMRGAITVTATHWGELAAGKPLTPRARLCSKILTDRGLPPTTNYGTDHEEVNLLCENFHLFLDTARGLGINPTRSGWATALQRLGGWEPSIRSFGVFRPGKFDGADKIATLKWDHTDCQCFKQVSGFRPAHG